MGVRPIAGPHAASAAIVECAEVCGAGSVGRPVDPVAIRAVVARLVVIAVVVRRHEVARLVLRVAARRIVCVARISAIAVPAGRRGLRGANAGRSRNSRGKEHLLAHIQPPGVQGSAIPNAPQECQLQPARTLGRNQQRAEGLSRLLRCGACEATTRYAPRCPSSRPLLQQNRHEADTAASSAKSAHRGEVCVLVTPLPSFASDPSRPVRHWPGMAHRVRVDRRPPKTMPLRRARPAGAGRSVI